MPTLLLASLAVVLLTAWPAASPSASAQSGGQPVVYGLSRLGVSYVDAASLAVALGDVVTHGDGILTWRGTEGVATFFAGSADALLQRPGNAGADDWALSAPVLADLPALEPVAGAVSSVRTLPHGWALPLDAVQLLGVAFERVGEETLLQAARGATFRLVEAPNADVAAGRRAGGGAGARGGAAAGSAADGDAAGASGSENAHNGPGAVSDGWEMTEIAGVPALRFFAEPDTSLLLLDLDLAPLAFPEATAAVDEAVAKAGSDHALLLIVSALSQQSWNSSLVFEQDGRRIEVRHPYRLRVYQGEPNSVGPGASVAAVVLLPSSYSLYRPLSVAWEDIDATVTFRR